MLKGFYAEAGLGSPLLLFVAVAPAIYLMVKMYRSDRLEPEPRDLLARLALAGVLSTLLAMVEEIALENLLVRLLPVESPLFNVILYFLIVGLAEESSKYLFLKKRSWDHPAFNCLYDGVVYAVFVSLGFALFENITYVAQYGLQTGLVRAVTAIPGHASFAVYMGIFYGLSKERAAHGDPAGAKRLRILAILLPMLIHGAYDYIATMETGAGLFLLFIIALFYFTRKTLADRERKDRYFRGDGQ